MPTCLWCGHTRTQTWHGQGALLFAPPPPGGWEGHKHPHTTPPPPLGATQELMRLNVFKGATSLVNAKELVGRCALPLGDLAEVRPGCPPARLPACSLVCLPASPLPACAARPPARLRACAPACRPACRPACWPACWHGRQV